jgi:ABC-type glutathione transport system ATPase component
MDPTHREARGTAASADRPRDEGPVVSIRGLDFSYEESGRHSQVLFDIDLDIRPGEIVLLTGPSGWGSTGD